MSDFIELRQKRAAVSLADTGDYVRSAQLLGITVDEFKEEIEALEERLCLFLFEMTDGQPSLTQEGCYLIERFREALARATEN